MRVGFEKILVFVFSNEGTTPEHSYWFVVQSSDKINGWLVLQRAIVWRISDRHDRSSFAAQFC